MAVTVYETDVPRFVGRFAVSNKESPGGGGFEGSSAPTANTSCGRSPGAACVVTEIETSKPDVDGAKNKKCS